MLLLKLLLKLHQAHIGHLSFKAHPALMAHLALRVLHVLPRRRGFLDSFPRDYLHASILGGIMQRRCVLTGSMLMSSSLRLRQDKKKLWQSKNASFTP